MFEELFHKITFGIFRKKDVPVAASAPPVAASAPPAPAPPAPAPPAAPGVLVKPVTINDPPKKTDEIQDLKSSTPGLSQVGGGRRRRRGSRGSRGSRESRSKSKRGGFNSGDTTHQAMGFGRAGGDGHRRSKKRNTHKRRK